jgi:hypothetical protein
MCYLISFVYDILKYFLLITLYTFVRIKIIDNIKLINYVLIFIYYETFIKLK